MTSRPVALLRVLLVEDDEGFVELLSAWLDVRSATFGVHLHDVGDLQEAKIALQHPEEFDVVALDLLLPDCPTDDLERSVRELSALQHAPPIVAMSSFSEDVGAPALQAGADDFVVKSSNPGGLEALLRSLHHAVIRRTLKVEKDALLAQVRLHNVQLERLARVMAHDLLTPVTVAFGSVETAVLLIDHGQVDSAKLHLQTAHRRLLELTDQMQNVLDETIKGSSVGSYAVDVAPAAELAYASLSPESRDRLHLVTDAGPAVSALPGTLRQVFQNLLSNAAAHNPDDVTVTVASHQVGEWVVVTVQDNGIGWRDDPTLLAVEGTSTAGSTGLGLVTVRHAIEGLGGSVVFGNSDLGGARIDLRLPAPQPDHELEPAVPAIG